MNSLHAGLPSDLWASPAPAPRTPSFRRTEQRESNALLGSKLRLNQTIDNGTMGRQTRIGRYPLAGILRKQTQTMNNMLSWVPLPCVLKSGALYCGSNAEHIIFAQDVLEVRSIVNGPNGATGARFDVITTSGKHSFLAATAADALSGWRIEAKRKRDRNTRRPSGTPFYCRAL